MTALIFLLSLGFIFPLGVKADTITNVNGIEITEEDYNNFIKLHSHEYIMTMNESQYEKLLSLNYDNVVTTKKYIATTYNPNLMLTTETELTEEEYENFIVPEAGMEIVNNPNLNSGGVSYETTAKLLTLAFTGGTTWNYAVLTASWKYLPSVRVFDVIGFRGDGFSFRNGSQTGSQMYIDANGDYQSIYYSWNGTNIKKFDDGFGISMNLVNPTIQALVLDAACDVKATVTHPVILGAYEHAVNSSVNLAQSQNYTLGGAGLGSVFVYPYNISSKYDGMSGVRIEF